MKNFSIILLISLLTVGCETQRIIDKQEIEEAPKPIRVPDYVEVPRVVPFLVDLGEPIKKGDRIEVMIDDNLAYSVWTDSDMGVDFLSGRVRSRRGKLAASVLRSDGKLDSAVVQFRQTGSAFVPSGGDSSRECKERAKSGAIKFLCENSMGKNSYIGEVVISTSKGNAHVSLTPYASKDPFGWVKGDFNNATIIDVGIIEN